MKLFTRWVLSAGLVLVATAANAQILTPNHIGGARFSAVSDFGEPYGGPPSELTAPAYGPALLPPQEVYSVLRENGFSPLGAPHQHGFVYTIAVMDRSGEDGRLVIDARNGQIIRFTPAYRMGPRFDESWAPSYGPAGSVPPAMAVRGVPRPPGLIPHVANRVVPVPMPIARPAEPSQRSAAVETKPADAPTAAQATVGVARSAPPLIQPTREMPGVQGLD
jgi:hypothetical protein